MVTLWLKVNTLGSGGRVSLLGKRLIIATSDKRNGTREETDVEDAEDLTRKESRAIIGCSQEITLPMFW